jgi:hypothetical protein
MIRIRTLAVVAIALGLACVTSLRAADADVDPVGKALGKAIISTVRPSTLLVDKGYEPQTVSCTTKTPRAGRCDITVKIRWYGYWTKTEYNSTAIIKVEVHDSGVEILGIDYTDDCLVPAPDVRLLNALVRELNEHMNDRR